jgi:Na+/H+-dicarboxylate symporter
VSHAPSAPAPQNWYVRIPLYLKIVVALILGIVLGQALGPKAAGLRPVAMAVLQLLALLATPLVFIAVVHAIVKAAAGGRSALRLAWLLLSNTTVAILIGLLVANVIRPGTHMHLGHAEPPAAKGYNAKEELLGKLPRNFIDPFQKNDILPLIIIAVSMGVAMRTVRANQRIQGRDGYKTVEGLLDTGFELVMVMLHWVLALVPFAVFAVVAATVGVEGIGPLRAMLIFVVSVLAALFLQAIFYLTRLRFGSWVRPGVFLHNASDALLLAFSTASSAITLPVTYKCVKDKIGVREESAGLGVMVGGTFNHDGTALYEAMAALFVSQAIGQHLSIAHQVLVVLMSIVASVGAAGIPEAGTVTMIAVFSAVGLPIEYIPLLLPLDWFLDRCRTAINVMGDMTVTCLLDGRVKPVEMLRAPEQSAGDGARREAMLA